MLVPSADLHPLTATTDAERAGERRVRLQNPGVTISSSSSISPDSERAEAEAETRDLMLRQFISSFTGASAFGHYRSWATVAPSAAAKVQTTSGVTNKRL